MTAYVLRRVLQVVPVLIGVSILAFLMSHLVPGDPVSVMLGQHGTAEEAERLREELGLNDPIYVQYGRFVWHAVQGDLGRSIRSGQPVLTEIRERFGTTLTLTIVSVGVAVVVGMSLGVAAATSGKMGDAAIMAFALLGISMPYFWSGILLILLFGLKLGWLPVAGSGPKALVLPAITLAAPAAAVLARMTRSTMLEVLNQDFVRTARAKGLREQIVVVRHVLKNALIPVVTIIGLQFGGLLSGSVIVESVFSRPGLGRYTVTAIEARDFPQIQGIVLVTAAIYVFVNLAVDLLYAVLDPRIRYH
ncbi:MAG TPA: ABC transporter permease [Thermomicrobiales bacterium]|nr:ABC transporter permease [Thermomicrobiales bacterium]